MTHESNDALIVLPTSNAEFLRQLRLTRQRFLLSLNAINEGCAISEKCAAEWINTYACL